MSQVTPPSSWALLLYARAERSRPSYPFFFFTFRFTAEMPPDAGHGKRESAPATVSGCLFPVLKPSCRAFAWRGNGRQDRLKTSAAGRTPASASHARMTMTLAGLLSRGRKAGLSPLSVAPPFEPSPWRVAPFRIYPFSFPPLHVYVLMFPCRHSRRHQWSFSLQGQR